MEEAARKFPHSAIEIQRTLEDGGLVAVHSRVKPAGRDIAAVHLFRTTSRRS